MIKLFSQFLLFGLSSFTAIAQNNFPPVFEIKTDTVLSEILPNIYWQMLEEKDQKMNFEEVSNFPVAERFHYDSARKINFQIPTYWFRFTIKNIADHKLKIGFYDSFKSISDWYFIRPDGNVTHKKSGKETPWSKNEGLKLNSYFLPENFLSFIIDTEETIVIYNKAQYDYFNYSHNVPRKFSIYYGSTDKIIKQYYVDNDSYYFNNLHDTFFFGFMFLAALFNFFFFMIVRERTYLYFALYVFFLGFGRFNIEGAVYHIFLREHPLFYAYFIDFIWVFTGFFLAYFIRSLLNTKMYYPRWDRSILLLTWLYAVSFVGSLFIDYNLRGTSMWGIGNLIGNIVFFALELSLLLTFFLVLNQKKYFDKRFLIAILPAFVIWVFGVSFFQLSSNFLFEFHFVGSFDRLVNAWHIIETICLIWLVLCFSWLLFHRFVELRQQVVQKELEKEIERSQLIAMQKIELEKQVTERTSELKQSLENLKSTQTQLIQSEKMASLGELTAGIAHEIQNPLNFVNNFSEVNKELVDELKTELATGNMQLASEIANDIKDNSEKINHHGKRADAIVKGMLQHSRSSSGKKELTDINALADEYLRLAYHGLRAKDKSFNAKFETDLDTSIGKINVVPQEIGRVILNLINNAFYAVSERKKQNEAGYEPTVTVSTKRNNGKIEIKVRDNGIGIPQKVLDKIFQPFFTTKPTGQGTGLGLSLSYDIVKVHGGELKVETIENEGAEFTIVLPG